MSIITRFSEDEAQGPLELPSAPITYTPISRARAMMDRLSKPASSPRYIEIDARKEVARLVRTGVPILNMNLESTERWLQDHLLGPIYVKKSTRKQLHDLLYFSCAVSKEMSSTIGVRRLGL